MLHRWIIRGLFLLPILVCVGGWAWSGTHYGGIRYSHDSHLVECVTARGVVSVEWGRMIFPISDGWHSLVTVVPARFWPSDDPNFGLEFGSNVNAAVRSYELQVPYWLLSVLSSAVLFFVWRKTRPKINPKMAFPVEAGKPDGATPQPR